MGALFLIGPSLASEEWGRRSLKAAHFNARKHFVIAVDGGLANARDLGLRPQLAIGDWDSLRDKRLTYGVEKVTLPRDKDRSDLFFALEAAKLRRPKRLHLIGFSEGRLDQEWLALLDCAQALAELPRGTVITVHGARATVMLARDGGTVRWRSRKGSVVSLFAPLGAVQLSAMRGLRFRLRDGEALMPSSQGLSNRTTASCVSVAIKKGILGVVIPHLTDYP